MTEPEIKPPITAEVLTAEFNSVADTLKNFNEEMARRVNDLRETLSEEVQIKDVSGAEVIMKSCKFDAHQLLNMGLNSIEVIKNKLKGDKKEFNYE